MKIAGLVRILVCLAMTLPVAATVRSQDAVPEWKALLSENKDGTYKAFPTTQEGIKKLKDKEWLTIHYTSFEGYKPRLGVVFSQEKQFASEYNEDSRIRHLRMGWGRGAKPGSTPLDQIEDIVRQAMGGTNRFTMVERTSALHDVTGEQDLAANGRVDKGTSANIGSVKAAEYVVKATIIEVDPEKEARDIQVIGGGIGGALVAIGSSGSSGKVAWVRLNVRIVNSESGEIVQDMTVDGTDDGKNKSVGGFLGAIVAAGASEQSKSHAELSVAMQVCANKVAYFASNKFEDIPWQGAVASIAGPDIMINGGTNVGLKVGQVLSLMSRGDPITDPNGGTLLGYQSSVIGTIRIVSTQAKFSNCEIQDGGKGAKKGDMVRLVVSKN